MKKEIELDGLNYLAVDQDGTELIFDANEPFSFEDGELVIGLNDYTDPLVLVLPEGSIEKLIGRKLIYGEVVNF